MRRWLIVLIGLVAVTAWWLGRARPGAAIPGPTAAAPRVTAPGGEPMELDGPGEAASARSAVHETEPPLAFGTSPEESGPEAPVTRLTIRARLPDGRPLVDSQLQLLSSEPSLDRRRFASSEDVRRMGVLFSMSSGSQHTLFLRTDTAGTVVLEHVKPGLALCIRATDDVGAVAASLEGLVLASGEQREVALRLERHATRLRGRCIDESGRALPGATVTVSGPSIGMTRETDENGEFEIWPLFDAEGIVRATLEDRIAVERFDVPADGSPIEIVLSPGRRLVVETVDVHGERVSNVGIGAYDLGSERALGRANDHGAKGQVFDLLPRRPVVLRWGVSCGRESKTIDVAVEHVRIVVQPRGTLAIEVGPLPGGLEAAYAVGLNCPDGVAQAWSVKGIQNTGHQQHIWTLFPGRYQVQILRQSAFADDGWDPWGAPLDTEVRSGETTFERLGG